MKYKVKSFLPLLLILGLTCIFQGCNKNVQLGGKVTFSENDEPLNIGTVVFENEKTQARGTLSNDGRYSLGSVSLTDGIPHGSYQVYIVDAYRPGAADGDSMDFLIDEKFTDPSTSGLTMTIDGTQKTFDIKIERPKKE